MTILRRLLNGIAVLIAAGLGYLYGTSGDHFVINAADPPRVEQPVESPPPPTPSPSVSQLEQAAYTFAQGFERLERMDQNLENVAKLLAHLSQAPPVWVVIVEREPKPAPPQQRPAPAPIHQLFRGLK